MADTTGKVQLNELQYDVANIAAGRGLIQQGTVEIVFGEPPQADASDIAAKDFWSLTYSGTGNTYLVKEGDRSLSSIAQEVYGTDRFYVPSSKMSEPFDPYFSNGVPLYYFFPLIVLATYKKMQTDSSFYIKKENPDFILLGRNLCVPPLDLNKAKSLIGDSTVADIFRLYNEYYINTNKESWAQAFHDIYMYLKYGSQ